MYLTYLIINVFNFKTLKIWNKCDEIIKRAVANVGCLEDVFCFCLEKWLTEKFYKKLIVERLKMNLRFGTSQRLSIYTANAKYFIFQLGSLYDPQVIALEELPKNVATLW